MMKAHQSGEQSVAALVTNFGIPYLGQTGQLAQTAEGLGSSDHSNTRLDLMRAPVRWLADRTGVHLPLSRPDGAPARDPGSGRHARPR